jgi:putative chitinase
MLMPDERAFFDHCRRTVMGPTLDQNEVDGAKFIVGAMHGLPIAWVAYALATAWHETAHTMMPIKERGSRAYLMRNYDVTGRRPRTARAMGNVRVGDGVTFCGRGFVQLTWANNYKRAGEKLGVDLYNQPHLAMRPDIAAAIMRHGMREGWFTGRSFQSFLPAQGLATRAQFRLARQIINAMDKAALIAAYAVEFQEALRRGKYAF